MELNKEICPPSLLKILNYWAFCHSCGGFFFPFFIPPHRRRYMWSSSRCTDGKEWLSVTGLACGQRLRKWKRVHGGIHTALPVSLSTTYQRGWHLGSQHLRPRSRTNLAVTPNDITMEEIKAVTERSKAPAAARTTVNYFDRGCRVHTGCVPLRVAFLIVLNRTTPGK